MAKILREGMQKSEEKPWIGQRIVCKKCACIFELEDDDQVRLDQVSRYLYLRCPSPHCGTGLAAQLGKFGDAGVTPSIETREGV